ncbi:MAG: hypothetical protein K2W82_16560 [Candidatus Obscuribacterales bacterium]|nr:hypothetical protein [Candidatus Obscuribacterales bacterium]
MSPNLKKWSFTAVLLGLNVLLAKLIAPLPLFKDVKLDLNSKGCGLFLLTAIVVAVSSAYLFSLLKLPKWRNQVVGSFLASFITWLVIPASLLIANAIAPVDAAYSGSIWAWVAISAQIAGIIALDDWNRRRIDSQVAGS